MEILDNLDQEVSSKNQFDRQKLFYLILGSVLFACIYYFFFFAYRKFSFLKITNSPFCIVACYYLILRSYYDSILLGRYKYLAIYNFVVAGFSVFLINSHIMWMSGVALNNLSSWAGFLTISVMGMVISGVASLSLSTIVHVIAQYTKYKHRVLYFLGLLFLATLFPIWLPYSMLFVILGCMGYAFFYKA